MKFFISSRTMKGENIFSFNLQQAGSFLVLCQPRHKPVLKILRKGSKVDLIKGLCIIWRAHLGSLGGYLRHSWGGDHPKVEYLHPPKTNMEPENGPLEKEIPIGKHHFQVPCEFLGCMKETTARLLPTNGPHSQPSL